MKNTAIIFLLTLFAAGCSGQQEGSHPENTGGHIDENRLTQPKVTWKVEKEVDENGNVIRYDSTFVWSYSNNDGDWVTVDEDSLLQSFRMFFNDRFPPLMDRNMGQLFMNDSLLFPDFFRDDYFQSRWQRNLDEMEMMMRQMDSLRYRFFMENYPVMIQPENGDEI